MLYVPLQTVSNYKNNIYEKKKNCFIFNDSIYEFFCYSPTQSDRASD